MTKIIRTNSVFKQWRELNQHERIQHILSNSELYKKVKMYNKLARNIRPMVKQHEE